MRPYLFIFLLIILLSACSSQENLPIDEKVISSKGVTLSPKSFNAEDFNTFFTNAKEAGDYISWSGNWNELSNTQNSGAAVVSSLSSSYGYIPVIIATIYNSTNYSSEQYKTSAVTFAEKYQPPYMGFGIEVNTLYEESPEEFEEFMILYSEVYNAVKKVSPNTKIFPTYQLEKMKGLHGGLFGGVNDLSKTEWELLEKFPSDVIAFTTYPGIIYTDPSEIPENYYTDLALHTDKKIIFTEVGWTSRSSTEGWESSEEEQAIFVERFFYLTKDLSVEFALWSFLFDQDISEPFTSMGLFDKEGKPKKAWEIWKQQ